MYPIKKTNKNGEWPKKETNQQKQIPQQFPNISHSVSVLKDCVKPTTSTLNCIPVIWYSISHFLVNYFGLFDCLNVTLIRVH